MVMYFLEILSSSQDFALKDWSILGENMHVKSDCIFKAAFGLKYSLGKSLLIWNDKSV